jgi:hypothetical protein
VLSFACQNERFVTVDNFASSICDDSNIMKSTRKRGVKHAFTLEIQSLAVNANGVTKPPSKNLLNLSGFNLGKLFDPMNLLEPILAKKIGLSCKKKAVA